MDLDNARIREHGQQSIQAKNVKGCLQEPSLAPSLVLKHLELIPVMAISGHSVAAIQPRPIGGKVHSERKVLGLEGHELQVNAFRWIVGCEGVLAPHFWR